MGTGEPWTSGRDAVSDEDRLITLTNSVASIPPGSPPEAGAWLRRMQEDAHRRVFPDKLAAGRAALASHRGETK